jgi:predicted PhzF superfamily epimerase YddE/YHI9
VRKKGFVSTTAEGTSPVDCLYNEAAEGVFHWRIAQGIEVGRPSVLEARAEKREGIVTATWVGGGSVLVSEGVIEAHPDLK